MVRKIKWIFPLLLLLALAIGCGAIYHNGSSNGLPAPRLTAVYPSHSGGIALEWEGRELDAAMSFAIYRSENGGTYELLDSTREMHYLDASSLLPQADYSYAIALCAYNHYGDGEYVFSDVSNEMSASAPDNAPYEEACFSADDLKKRLMISASAFAEEISLLYIGEWSDGLWEETVKSAEDDDPFLSWHYYAVDGTASYEGIIGKQRAYRLTYRFAYYADSNEQAQVKNALPDLLSLIRTKYALEKDPEPYRVIKAVYSHLAETVRFDATKRNDGDRMVERSSAYDALIVRRASSKGIALAAKTLLDALGIPCECVSGDGYCFNMVCVDDSWYHFDACSAVCAREKQNAVSYAYLLMRESDMDRVKDAVYAKGSEFAKSHPLGSLRFKTEPDAPVLTGCTVSEEGISLSYEYKGEGLMVYADGALIGETKDRSIVHTNPESGKVYTYTAYAYRTDSAGEKLLSPPGKPTSAVKPISIEQTPAAPALLSVEQTASDTLSVDFEPVEGASAYIVYRIENGRQTEIARCAYPPCQVKPSQKEGLLAVGAVGSALSEPMGYKLLSSLSAPLLSTVTGREIVIDPQFEGTYLIVKTDQNGAETVSEWTGGPYTDTQVDSGICYTYRIRPKEGSFVGPASEPAVLIPLPPIGEITAEGLSDGIRLSWKVDGEEGVCSIFRANSADGPYTFLATERQGHSFIDSTAVSGKLYFYKLCRTLEENADRFSSSPYSEPIAAVSLDTTHIESGLRNTTGNTVVLSWRSVEGADGYLIRRETEITEQAPDADAAPNGESASVSEPMVFTCEGKCTYTDLTAMAYESYRYTVTPYIRKGGERICASSSQPMISFSQLNAKKYTDTAQTLLEWSPCASADGYIILRSTGGSPFSVIAVTSELTMVMNNAANVSNDFKIYAYKESGSGRLFGQEMLFVESRRDVSAETAPPAIVPPSDDPSPEAPAEPTESTLSRILSSTLMPLSCVLVMLVSLYAIKFYLPYARKKNDSDSDPAE
ncbi:MAG: transglutaminase domain-containing protein [Ruminococcaceae bacterium]|nr:transglutaminase domain-containing protein [Oscillospiraceae bacterium]